MLKKQPQSKLTSQFFNNDRFLIKVVGIRDSQSTIGPLACTSSELGSLLYTGTQTH